MDALAPARLLVIDRDAERARAAGYAFASCFLNPPGIVAARCGREAGELLRAGPVALILADLASIDDLAGSTADSVTRLVRLGGSALTIALTSDTSVSAAVAAMRAGAHDVVGRPFARDTLADRIGQLCRRHGKALGLVADDAGAAPPPPGPAVIGMDGMPRPQDVLPMWRQEQKIIEDAIASFAGNIALAAAALELSPSTIYRKRQMWAEAQSGRKGAA